MKSEYEIQADNFLKETKTTFNARYLKHGAYFPGDKNTRDIFSIIQKW